MDFFLNPFPGPSYIEENVVKSSKKLEKLE